jgi:hypothetical protein
MDKIDLTEDTDKWRALVNVVMNIRAPYVRNNWTEELFAIR